jgi:hypothetical protein
MGRIVWALLLLSAVAGCATNVDVADTLFIQPGKYDFLRCQDLAPRAAGRAVRERELLSLMERANQDAAGPVINAMVYAADLEQVRAEQRLLQKTMREKNCDPPAPQAPPSQPSPPARGR